jgi:hypothetical protein
MTGKERLRDDFGEASTKSMLETTKTDEEEKEEPIEPPRTEPRGP